MTNPWTQPQYVWQGLSLTSAGVTQSGTIALDTTYTNHLVAFSFTAPAAGDTFTLTLYGDMVGELPGNVPYMMGSVVSSTVHGASGSWVAGYNNVGYLLVTGVPAGVLYVDIDVTTYNGALNGSVSVNSSL